MATEARVSVFVRPSPTCAPRRAHCCRRADDLSREAGEDAGGAAVAIAGDLARLRHLVIAADFDVGPVDVNVHESVETSVQPRREGEVVVVGRLAVSLDYDTDGEHP